MKIITKKDQMKNAQNSDKYIYIYLIFGGKGGKKEWENSFSNDCFGLVRPENHLAEDLEINILPNKMQDIIVKESENNLLREIIKQAFL